LGNVTCSSRWKTFTERNGIIGPHELGFERHHLHDVLDA
jgi:hypothetical protein